MKELRLVARPGAIAFLLLLACIARAPAAESSKLLRSNDVLCFVGGANIVAAQQYGYFETIVRIAFPNLNLKVRSIAHEGDTVYAQPRDYNYPDIQRQLTQYGATVVLAQFGQMEALDATNRLPQFVSAYEKLLTQFAQNGRRVVVISPFPFERMPPQARLPDLAARNEELREWVSAIRTLAGRRDAAFIDLFTESANGNGMGERLTTDGVHLKPKGHWRYDLMTALTLGVKPELPEIKVDAISGVLSLPIWERVRQEVIVKNRLWFN